MVYDYAVLPVPRKIRSSIQRIFRASSVSVLVYFDCRLKGSIQVGSLFSSTACVPAIKDDFFHRRVRYPSGEGCELLLLQLLSTRRPRWTSFAAGEGMHQAELSSFSCRADQQKLASSTGWIPYSLMNDVHPGKRVNKSSG